MSNKFTSVLIKDFSHALNSDWTKVEIEFNIRTWSSVNQLSGTYEAQVAIKELKELLKCHLEYFCHLQDHLYPCTIKQRRMIVLSKINENIK